MSKTERLHLRCTPETAALLREAADAQGQDLTSFVLGAAIDRARRVIVEDRVLRLSPHDLQTFEQALAREGEVPQLARLFAKVDELAADRTSSPR